MWNGGAGERFQVVQDTTGQLLAQICSRGDCWEAFPDRAALCITQGWFLPDGRPAWNVEHRRCARTMPLNPWAVSSHPGHVGSFMTHSASVLLAHAHVDVASGCPSRRETTSVSMFAESLVHRQVPQLVEAALGNKCTAVSPTGQQTARCSNPILLESVMMDSFPMPFTLPVCEGEHPGGPENCTCEGSSAGRAG